MKSAPDAVAGLPALAALAEQYMESMPTCFLCHDWPAMMPMAFVADTRKGDRVHGCVFAVCPVCMCQDNFEHRISEALSTARAKGQGVWN
jgi:hypothetical protein